MIMLFNCLVSADSISFTDECLIGGSILMTSFER